MKKTTFTRIRYEGKRLEPGTYDFDKDFIAAHPDVFKPEVSITAKVPQHQSALESAVNKLEETVENLSTSLSEKDKEIEALKAKIAASGGK